MKRISILFAVLGMTCLTACMDGTQQKTDESLADSSAFKIALMPIKESEPFIIADSCGIFDSLGVHVRLVPFESAMDADTAFTNGNIDILVTDSLKAAFLNGNPDSLHILLHDTLNLSLMTSKTARIKDVKNLKEKIVAVTRNSALDYFADKMMLSAKLKPEELNRPQINNLSLRASMLDQQQYDGAILPEPLATECEKNGAKRVVTAEKLGIGRLLTIVVRKKFYNEHKDDIDRIMEAYRQAR